MTDEIAVATILKQFIGRYIQGATNLKHTIFVTLLWATNVVLCSNNVYDVDTQLPIVRCTHNKDIDVTA